MNVNPSEIMSAERDVLDANQAFYQAFQNKDMTAMSAVWSQGTSSLCVHPGRQVLKGWEDIRAGWEKIFRVTKSLEIELQITATEVQENMAYVVLVEKVIQMSGSQKNKSFSVATNIFELMGGKWYLIHHHGSPILR
jgi:ketosteroid isomerase-like protein